VIDWLERPGRRVNPTDGIAGNDQVSGQSPADPRTTSTDAQNNGQRVIERRREIARPPATRARARCHRRLPTCCPTPEQIHGRRRRGQSRRDDRGVLVRTTPDVEAAVMILEKRFARDAQRLRTSRRNCWHET